MELNKVLIWKCILAVILAFTIFSVSAFAATNWWNESFDYRKQINLTNTGSVNLTNFPVYLNISKETSMQSDYDDLRFLLGECLENLSSILDYEIEFNNSNRAEIWLKIPNFQTGINTICMYYGNSTVSTGATNTAVWNSDYGIVYHMDTTGQDSTANNRDRVSDVGSPILYNKIIGNDLGFDGNDAWNLANIGYWEQAWGERVHEAIFDTGSDITSRQTILAEGGGTNGISMYLRNSQIYVRWWSESLGWGGAHLNASILANTKYHAVMVYDDKGGSNYEYSLYLNGKFISNGSSSVLISGHTGDGGIGYSGPTNKDYHDVTNSGGNYYMGNITEIRTLDLIQDKNWYLQTYQNSLNHTSNSYYAAQEQYFPEISVSIISPSTAALASVLQNTTFELNVTLNCIGKSSSSCSNISLNSRYNDSISSFTNIATSSTTPAWTSSLNPQSIVLNGGSSQSFTWIINMTGAVASTHLINILASSNNSLISNSTSDNLTVKIVAGNVVSFNQTSYDYPPFYKNSGNKITTLKVNSDIGNNTNIIVSCESGDCSTITENWIDGININESSSQDINFTCSDNSVGSYSAIFNVTSNEFTDKNTITITCQVDKVYGPISVNILEPLPLTINTIGQNQTFTLKANVSCNGECGNITTYAVYYNASVVDNWWNKSFKFRKEIIINNVGSTSLSNFPAYLNISKETVMQSDYDDLRFIDGACGILTPTLLSHEIDYYDSNKSIVWVKIPTLSTGNNSICVYYGDNLATNIENPTDVWSNSFDAVWHFGETGSDDRLDSTSNSYDAAPFNYDNDELIDGIIGKADRFDGSNDYLALRTINFNSSNQIPEMTTCVWFRTSFVGTAYNDNWAFIDFDRSEYFDFYIRGDNGGLGYSTTGGGIDDQNSGTTGLNDGLWHYGCAVYDGTDKRIYVDGNLDNTAVNPHAGANLGTANTRYGFLAEGSEASTFNGGGNNIWYDGDMDETQLSLTTRSGDWINQSYQMVGNHNSVVSYFAQDKYYGGDIINTSINTPLWTISSQPQSCIISEDGTCLFEWIINASGNINTMWNISIFAQSNYSSINVQNSIPTTINITDNIIPRFNLYEPANFSKIITNGSVDFTWMIIDDDSTLNCSLYLNGVLNQTILCSSGLNTSLNLNLPSGKYEWFVYVNDSLNNQVNSSTFTFWNIINSSNSISKEIVSFNTNMYKIDINIQNKVNITKNIVPIDFVESKFNYGSFNILYNWTNTTTGFYDGKILGWTLNLPANTNQRINYSITKNMDDYYLLDEFVIGLD